jgi:hypothetical protein
MVRQRAQETGSSRVGAALTACLVERNAYIVAFSICNHSFCHRNQGAGGDAEITRPDALQRHQHAEPFPFLCSKKAFPAAATLPNKTARSSQAPSRAGLTTGASERNSRPAGQQAAERGALAGWLLLQKSGNRACKVFPGAQWRNEHPKDLCLLNLSIEFGIGSADAKPLACSYFFLFAYAHHSQKQSWHGVFDLGTMLLPACSQRATPA